MKLSRLIDLKFFNRQQAYIKPIYHSGISALNYTVYPEYISGYAVAWIGSCLHSEMTLANSLLMQTACSVITAPKSIYFCLCAMQQ